MQKKCQLAARAGITRKQYLWFRKNKQNYYKE